MLKGCRPRQKNFLVFLPLLFVMVFPGLRTDAFCAHTSRSWIRILRPKELPGPRSVRKAEEMEEDVEEEIDLDADPNWSKVKQEMVRIWNIRYESEDWLDTDDVKGLMDEHLQTVVGKQNYLDMEDVFVEA
eukprot:symbB.v1.2.019074.t2/scaffold1542.1/size112718/9